MACTAGVVAALQRPASPRGTSPRASRARSPQCQRAWQPPLWPGCRLLPHRRCCSAFAPSRNPSASALALRSVRCPAGGGAGGAAQRSAAAGRRGQPRASPGGGRGASGRGSGRRSPLIPARTCWYLYVLIQEEDGAGAGGLCRRRGNERCGGSKAAPPAEHRGGLIGEDPWVWEEKVEAGLGRGQD